MKFKDYLFEFFKLIITVIIGDTTPFAIGMSLVVIPVVFLIVGNIEISVVFIIASIISVLAGVWLIRSVIKDYKEKYRRNAIKEEQRKKGLRD